MRRDASFPRVVLAVLAVPAALSILACTPSEPDDAPRVLTVVPEGDGVVPDLPGIQVRFSEPIDPSGVEDGRFVALATDADAKSVATAAGSDTGIPPGAAIVPARVVLDVGGLAAAVTPETPLLPLAGYAIVVGTGIRSVSGKAVLDPTGRKRAFATTFRTGPMPDRVPPAARWIAPPHGPVPQNLKEIRVGFSEPVTGTLKVNSVAGTPRAVAADILALALEGTLPIGPLAPALDAVHDAGGNRPPELPAIAVSACRDVSAPVIDPASFRVATTDTTLTVTAESSELSRVAIEVAAEQSGEACGTVPEPPATLVGWGDFVPCPGSDPCGAVTRCPVTATATGLCPGRRVRVRLLAEDLAGNASTPATWVTATTGTPVARVVLTEVLAAAVSPQAGGEYAELANLGSGDADLTGFRLAKRTTSGTVTRCTIEPRNGLLPAGGHGLLVGGSWDGRYTLPAGVTLFTCGSTSLLGGLADDQAPALALESATGAVVAGFGWAAPSLRCTGRSVERIQPGGEDVTASFACALVAPGTPGTCNGNTPAAACPRRPY